MDETPKNAVRVTAACILAQLSIGYGFRTLVFAPYEMVIPPSAEVPDDSPHRTRKYLTTGVIFYIYILGVFTGPLALLPMSNVIGRRIHFGVGALLACIAGILQATATHLVQFNIGRGLGGIAAGIVLATGPVWQVEVSTVTARGKLLIAQFASLLCGAAIAQWSFLFSPGPLWRIPLGCQSVPALLSFLVVLASPDSKIIGVRSRRQSTHAQDDDLFHDDSSPATTHDNHKTSYRIGLSVLIMVISGFSAVYKIIEYMLTESGLYSDRSSALFAGALTWSALCCALSVFSVEKLGRRKSLLVNFAGQATSLVPLAILEGIGTYFADSTVGTVLVELFGFVFLGFAGFGAGVLWLHLVEINNQHSRLAAAYMATAAGSAVYFATIFISYFMDFFPAWPLFFVATNVLGTGLTYFFLPETAGRSLAYIDRYFEPGALKNVSKNQSAVKVGWTEADEVDE